MLSSVVSISLVVVHQSCTCLKFLLSSMPKTSRVYAPTLLTNQVWSNTLTLSDDYLEGEVRIND